MKQFTSIHDVPDVDALIKRGLSIKSQGTDRMTPSHIDNKTEMGKGKTLILLFFNPSLRTRLSTQLAAQNLGMSVLSMNVDEGWKLEFEDGVIMAGDKAEHVKEAAAVVSEYADIIGIRTFPGLKDRAKDYSEEVLQQFVRYATVPVVNMESAIRHPLQSLADAMTIEEFKPHRRPKVVLSWAPHPRALPQAVPNSFLEWMKTRDVELVLTHPKGYELAPEFAGDVTLEYDQKKAFDGADFIYAKNWSSFYHYGQILSTDPDWMITPDKMALTNNGRFMHCLPVRRNVVVADAVMDDSHSLHLVQVKNREFAVQAVLEEILEAVGKGG